MGLKIPNNIKEKIKLAQEYRDKAWANHYLENLHKYPDKPAAAQAAVTGTFWKGMRGPGIPTRQINQILPKLKAKHDALTAGVTKFLCEPTTSAAAPLAAHVASLLNNIWRVNKFDTERNAARWDSEIYGFGVVEVGWKWEENKVDEPIIYNTPEDALEQIAKVDEPFIERFSPRRFLVDPACTSYTLKDARFVVRIKYELVEKLKTNKALEHTKELKGTQYSMTETDDPTTADLVVKLYDCYLINDNDEMVRVILCDEHDKPLYADTAWCNDILPKPNPFPFRIIPSLVLDNDTFYPEPSVYQALPLQISYDESYQAFNDQRKKSPRQYLVPKGLIDPIAMRKLEAGVDGAIIEVDAALKDQIAPFPHQPLRQEVYASLETLPIEIGRQMGVSPYDEAVLPSKELTKAEVLAIQSAGGTRTTGDAKKLREFTEDLGQCLLALIQAFGDRYREYSIETATGELKWGTISAREIRGLEWAVKVESAQEPPKNTDTDRQLKLQLLSVVSQFAALADPQTGMPMINLRPVLKMVLDSFGIGTSDAVMPELTNTISEV